MKLYHLVIVLLTLPVTLAAQVNVGVRKMEAGKILDNSKVPFISNFGEPINYMIIGIDQREEYTIPGFYKDTNRSYPNLSDYYVAGGIFSLDFVVGSPIGKILRLSTPEQYLETKKIEDKRLVYSVLQNNRLIKNWTAINTLANDSSYQTGLFITDTGKETFSAWANYHAGKFKLSVNDSLVVLIKSSITNQIVESILIKRIRLIPHYYYFSRFSSDIPLKDIQFGKFAYSLSGKDIHLDSIDRYEMEPDEILVFRFPDDPGARADEVEYSYANNPDKWELILGPVAEGERTLPGYFSIVIYKPVPGETQEVRLRYKQQPESMHHIIVHVNKRPNNGLWYKILIPLAITILLFTVLYAFKRRSHIKQLRQVTLDKEETESKLQLLSGQLNPHFLFNSLNSVQNLINKNDLENATRYVSEVSSFLRIIMDTSKKEYISLAEELDMEEAYIKLEQKRKPFMYRINNNCNTPLSQIEFPPSLLQPIIENAIHHGLSKNFDDALITINVGCNKQQLFVSVADNGQGFNTASVEYGHGLMLVQKRISLLNEKLSGMPVEMKVTSTDTGTVTTFTFESWL